jgi:flavin-dependent dehydrogenase
MNNQSSKYDCAIIGGGLAGLTLSIQLAQNGHQVILFEKNKYPFHKVCGEYISLESWDFLNSLGLPMAELSLPIIKTIHVSAPNGFIIHSPLDLGGFGISRFYLDNLLFKKAKELGVTVLDNTKVLDVKQHGELYVVSTNDDSYQSKLVCGSFGKINPPFIAQQKVTEKGKYIGVKYHIKTDLPAHIIELHNFKDGYCGISKVDNDTYCLCYLTTTKNLRLHQNDIKRLEENILYENPYLKKYFTESEILYEKPLVISQISFEKKQTYQLGIIMLGDSAGAIAPLCGNGMSIAMRSSKILAKQIDSFLKNNISKIELIQNYTDEWNQNFSSRIKIAYYLQHLFGKKTTTYWSLKLLNYSPKLFKRIISLTHGQKF